MEEVNHTMDARRNARQQERLSYEAASGFIRPIVRYQTATFRLWSDIFEGWARIFDTVADTQQQQFEQQRSDKQQ